MKIAARIENSFNHHAATVETGGRQQTVGISPREDGFASAVNGGELLFLALATCYCNDLYREARKRGITLSRVRVDVEGDFAGEGCAATNIRYRAAVDASASRDEILDLMRHTDKVAEIHASLRQGVPVLLEHCEANSL